MIKYTLLVLLLLLASCTTAQETVKIGAIYPLTGSASAIGLDMQKATTLGVDEINAAGGVNGKLLEVVYEDGKCNGKDAATAASKLINVDKVKIILGGACSGETLGAAPIAEEAGVVLFSPGSTSPLVSSAGDYVFRNMPSDGQSAIKIVEKIGNKKAALLSENTEYSQSMADLFREHFTGDLVLDEKYEQGTGDFRTPLTKLKESDAEVVYILPQSAGPLGLIAKQMDEMNIDVPFYSNVFLGSADILDNYAVYVEGGVYSEPLFDTERTPAKEFMAKYKERYGVEIGGSIAPLWFATSYDAPFIMKTVLESGGDVKEELYAIENWEGAAGVLTIDENGDPISQYAFKVIRNGEAVPLE